VYKNTVNGKVHNGLYITGYTVDHMFEGVECEKGTSKRMDEFMRSGPDILKSAKLGNLQKEAIQRRKDVVEFSEYLDPLPEMPSEASSIAVPEQQLIHQLSVIHDETEIDADQRAASRESSSAPQPKRPRIGSQ
jgi:hypothetical protein